MPNRPAGQPPMIDCLRSVSVLEASGWTSTKQTLAGVREQCPPSQRRFNDKSSTVIRPVERPWKSISGLDSYTFSLKKQKTRASTKNRQEFIFWSNEQVRLLQYGIRYVFDKRNLFVGEWGWEASVLVYCTPYTRGELQVGTPYLVTFKCREVHFKGPASSQPKGLRGVIGRTPLFTGGPLI
jgi:hypothetical protein